MVWLRLWTEANASEESNTGKYYGVFMAISVGGLLAMGVDVWFVQTFLPSQIKDILTVSRLKVYVC